MRHYDPREDDTLRSWLPVLAIVAWAIVAGLAFMLLGATLAILRLL